MVCWFREYFGSLDALRFKCRHITHIKSWLNGRTRNTSTGGLLNSPHSSSLRPRNIQNFIDEICTVVDVIHLSENISSDFDQKGLKLFFVPLPKKTIGDPGIEYFYFNISTDQGMKCWCRSQLTWRFGTVHRWRVSRGASEDHKPERGERE